MKAASNAKKPPKQTPKQRRNERKLREKLDQILYEYGIEETTEWVIKNCPYWERMEWAILLWETTTGESLVHSEIVELLGETAARNLRSAIFRLKDKLPSNFSAE